MNNLLRSSIIFIASIALYILPITRTNAYISGIDLIHNPIPTLDEVYLTIDNNDHDNYDVKIDPKTRSSLSQLFQNDYWGRSMDSKSSHKSYRPVTVLSLRAGYFLADLLHMNGLFVQRVINVIIHAILVQMVGRLHQSIFKGNASGIETFIVMSLFMLHPTHIESVVNIANRAHLLSLLFTLASLDLNILLASFLYALGLLSCETAVFLYPAVCLTVLSIDICNRDDTIEGVKSKGICGHIRHRLLRYSLITMITFAYLYLRHELDWIHIPRGLIRPAENPFYTLQGFDRILNYSFVLSIHLVKSLGMGFVDLVGFSHEFGFNCVEKIDSLQDARLFISLLLLVATFIFFVWFCRKPCSSTKTWTWSQERILLILTFGAWMATLFPISGFIRVGTFISDRIVIASTVASSVLWTRIFCTVLKSSRVEMIGCNSKVKLVAISLIFLSASCPLWFKIQNRSAQWMHPVSLIQSSLETCPQSAKSNLEMSKVYSSGLFGVRIDKEKALFHIEVAQSIDPDYCDVHLQFAQSFVQSGKYLEFENVITKGIICKYTMMEAHSLFQQYWSKVLSNPSMLNNGARERYNVQFNIIQQAILHEKAGGEGVKIDVDSKGDEEL